MNNELQKPKHEVRFGTVKVAIWENESREGNTFHSFDLRRSYRDQEGNWHDQKISLNLNEIAKVQAALAKSYEDYHLMETFRRDPKADAAAGEGARS